MRSLAAVALGALVLLMGIPAQAATLRLPASGNPAAVVDMPDDWSSQPTTADSLLLLDGSHTASLAITIDAYAGTLDQLAAQTMKEVGASPPRNSGSTAVSGYRGYIYDSEMTNDSGVHINVHMIAVKLDDAHFASMTLMTVGNITGAQSEAASGVLNGVTLTVQ